MSEGDTPQAPAPRPPLRFRFNLPLTVIAVLMLAALISLGTWQTSRYFEKSDRLARYYAQHVERPPVTSYGEVKGEARLTEFHLRRAEIKGVLEVHKAHLLTSRYRLGEFGYGVLAPLRVEGGDYPRVIVNVGWVPATKIEEYLDEWKDGKTVVVTGRLQRGDNASESETVGEKAGRKTWRRINTRGLAEHIDGLDPEMMILAGEEASGKPIKLEDYPLDGYPSIERQPPSKNIEYAGTWYGLAVTLIVVYFAFSIRRRKEEDEDGSEAGSREKVE